jgi:hypothetical protein
MDGGKDHCSSDTMHGTVWNVEMRIWIPELLCKAKINKIRHASFLSNTNDDVAGLQVTMNEVA